MHVLLCSQMFSFSSLHGVNHVGTKGQQNEQMIEDTEMTKDIKTVIARSSDTLIADAIGAASLLVMLFVGLSLPGMV